MKARTYPPLPKSVMAPGGEVTVWLVDKAGTNGDAWGTWQEATRTVEIEKSAQPRHRWRVFYHEMTHVALDDAGLSNGMPEELVEAICDAMASARMRERFG